MKNSKLSKGVFLAFSLSLLFLLSCSTTQNRTSLPGKSLFDTTAVSKYSVLIKINQAEISGIMALKQVEDNQKKEWRGSLMNEFGIKAFDFIAPQGKCKLKNTIPFLNKWYIRRTIEADFAYMLWDAPQGKIVKGKSVETLPDGFVLKNEKRKIEYHFHLIE
jgi:hypothetical protein